MTEKRTKAMAVNRQGPSEPQKILRGAMNRAQGKFFEELIDISCKHYDMKGFAVIEKTPEPMKPVKSMGGGKFLAHFEKKAQPDYKGARRDGRAVVFEAKHTSGEKLEQDRVTKEQAERLNRYEEMGAVCFVLASFGRCGYFRIPWQTWKSMKEIFGRRYAKADELSEFEVPMRNGVLHFLERTRHDI